MKDSILALVEGLHNDYLITFFLSMIPIFELRGSIIYAAAKGLEWYYMLPIAIVGNLIPLPFILLLLRPVLNWMKSTKLFGKIAHKFQEKTLNKAGKIRKAEFYGLLIFVGIPLPGTGGWTGSAIAALLDMRLRRALPAIFLGVVLAGIIMTIASYGTLGIFSFI